MLYLYGSLALFGLTATLIAIAVVRQLVFSAAMVDKPVKGPFSGLDMGVWPKVAVLVPAHNEELVIEGCLDRLVALNYPAHLLRIVVINDRSTDGTKAILDRFEARYPSLVQCIHRPADAAPGKPAAIKEALDTIDAEIAVFFDADYLPQPTLLKRLITPFIDPQVGATMGRVLPYNTHANLLTRLLDLERRGGYAIDQKARGEWRLLPQFGGTVGGVRLSALQSVGGWPTDTLTEDTDVTYRLFLGGFTVEHVDDALCLEESPEHWEARFKQVRRWACGHNQCLFRYFIPTLTRAPQPLLKRLDAAFVLLFYLIPPLSLLSLANALVFPTLAPTGTLGLSVMPFLALFFAFGNIAPYFQIFAAALRDRQSQTAIFLPFLFLSSSISLVAASQGLLQAIGATLSQRSPAWDKTARYRSSAHDMA